jgi:cell wall-associated NlpC family hydrolase
MALLVSAVILLAGCAVAPTSQFTDESGSQLALAAVGLVGVPYRFGGEEPDTGLDCSGLVRFAARTAWGLTLPRQTEAMSRFGVEVAPAQLRAGDLVFFNTLGKAFSHVGVYLGDDRFVHAPTQRGVVRVERLSSSYWRSRFDGARRLAAPADALHRSDAGRPDAKWSFRRNGNTRETP